jgi:cell cycle sensor histidine kinase DivJ
VTKNNVSVLTPVRSYVDTLVHPSAQQDALTAARHRAFIAPRVIGSFAALAAFPVYLALRGAPSVPEILVIAWLVAPILIAYFLSRTGRYESAQVLSSLALTGLITAIAVHTGGAASLAAIWLVVVPLEASLSASRRVVMWASLLALAAAVLLLALELMQGQPGAAGAADSAALTATGIVAAALYAAGLALGAQSLSRTGVSLVSQEENRYRLLARHMSDVITRHGRHGAVVFVSPAAEPLFGVPAHELSGHGLFERVHVADRPAYLKALSDAAATGEAQSVEFRARREIAHGRAGNDHRFIWIEMRCRPLAETAGKGDEVVAVMRDVSARKVQEQALEDARAAAERADAAKGQFLATMSHELRTPLNVIIGFSEMLGRDTPVPLDATRRRDYAQLINESGQHLLSVVNGILDMSRLESGNFAIMPEPCALPPAIATCCDLLALKAGEAGIALVRRIESDLPELVADKRSLNQILLNLISNALKFTPRGGTVTVGAVRDDGDIAVTVEDTGIGIAAEDLPRLGDPFFQAQASYDRRHDGSGLGLSIVKRLVELHGGGFEIRSRLGAGTTVTVRLPIDCEPTGRAPPAGDEDRRVIPLAAPMSTGAPVRRIA